MTYFTLRALAAEWDASLQEAVLVDAWTQSENELSLAFNAKGAHWTVRIVCESAQPFLFRTEGIGRARRNTATVFDSLKGQTVRAVETAERDRFFFFRIDDGTALQLQLFGPRPNVFWVEADGRVREAFLANEAWIGKQAPAPREAIEIRTQEALAERWPASTPGSKKQKTLGQVTARAVPLFDRALAAEAVRRAHLDPDAPAPPHPPEALYGAIQGLIADLHQPQPTVYWRGESVEAFALVPYSTAPSGWRAERFETVGKALRVWTKRKLAQRQFDEAYRPLAATLQTAVARRTRRAEAMLAELAKPSRADRYEQWGHLLMAQGESAVMGRHEITLSNMMGDGEPITIPLDPSSSLIENAERYYAKARKTREARHHADSRWNDVEAERDTAARLLDRLQTIHTLADLEGFKNEEKDALASLAGDHPENQEVLPYRQFYVAGWEIRVGKHARGNAALTTRHAGPHDLWLHARGVPGSHVVIPLPNRAAEPPKHVVTSAARLAAHFSNARTQSLAPVQVTERKYVRPIKGGPPGLVRVDREEVLLVEPMAPTTLMKEGKTKRKKGGR